MYKADPWVGARPLRKYFIALHYNGNREMATPPDLKCVETERDAMKEAAKQFRMWPEIVSFQWMNERMIQIGSFTRE